MTKTFHLVLAAAALTLAVPSVAMAAQGPKEVVIVMGAIKDPANAKYAKAPVDKSVPELPVVYESKDGK